MAARRGDGLTTPHSQPAKTLTKRTTDFIALCKVLILTDHRVFTTTWVVGLVGLLAASGLFQ